MQKGSAELLRVDNLTKVFQSGSFKSRTKVHAVNDVSFSIKVGKVTAIVGESGSGKSTVARLIARLTEPSSGTVSIGDQTINTRISRRQLMDLRKRVQIIFQDPFSTLNPFYTIGYHLRRPLVNYGLSGSTRETRTLIENVLESVGLTPVQDFIEKYPHELSGGQRQRVVIARAMIVNPKLLIADEPTSMLDVSIRMGILNLMKQLRDERKLSFLFITHDLASARYFSDQLLVMYAGKLVEGGDTDTVITEPAHPYTQLLLSAVPDQSRTELEAEAQFLGEPPNLAQLPSGCYFHPRCSFAMDICKQRFPEKTDLGNGHWVMCHLHQNTQSIQNA